MNNKVSAVCVCVCVYIHSSILRKGGQALVKRCSPGTLEQGGLRRGSGSYWLSDEGAWP